MMPWAGVLGVDSGVLYMCCGGGLDRGLAILVGWGGCCGVNMWRMKEIVKYLGVHVI